MKLIVSLWSCVLALFTVQGIHAEEKTTTSTSSINWLTSYEEAVNKASSAKKPMILFFTGSDWCGWCKRIEQEAFDTPEFASAAGDKFVFVKLDFPLYHPVPQQQTEQNKQLKQKFDIRGFPTLIILDDQQQKIGVTGYRPGGGSAYAEHLLKMVHDYQGYKQKLSALDSKALSSSDLKALYAKAKELNRVQDATMIVKTGMQTSDDLFFPLERYRFLAEEGQIHESEAKNLKLKILQSDPKNEKMTHYEIAVIDFEAISEEMDKDYYSAELAVAPLIQYIDKFGSKDKEHLWRVQMTISQVFLDKNNLQDALKYAQSSHKSAPSNIKPEIANAISNIESQLHLQTAAR